MADFSDVLLCVDYDRTLTAPDSTVPARNLEAIRFFMERGGAFTVNTGRSVPMFQRLLDQIPANAPFLLYNGSAAYDQKRKELTLCKPIQYPMAEILAAVDRQFSNIHVEVQGKTAHHLYRYAENWHQFYEGLGCQHADLQMEKWDEPFLKFSVFYNIQGRTVDDMYRGSAEEFSYMDAVEQWLKDTYGSCVEVYRAAPKIVDVHAKGVSKLTAARNLQAQLGKKLLVCVGDALNDVTMLDGADYAYCPADGGVADRYENVCPCAEGAVADVIYEKIPEILGIKP